jgi:hypothetical protein
MASVQLPLQAGRNLLSFPMLGSLAITDVLSALDPLEHVLHFEAFVPASQRWERYDVRSGTGDLTQVSFGQALVIEVSEPLYLHLPGVAYLPPQASVAPGEAVAQGSGSGASSSGSGASSSGDALVWPAWWPLWLRDSTLVGLLGAGLLALIGGLLAALLGRREAR